jgi:hypothetical protein
MPLAVLACAAVPGGAEAQVRFAEADVFFELNSTARDVGLHAFFDAEAWREVRILDPRGREVFEVNARGASRRIGVTELRFEGEEPNVSEVPFSRLRTLFPSGRYQFRGTTVEGQALRGSDRLTAELPCPTRIVSPAEGALVRADDLTVRWVAPPGVFNPDNQDCNARRNVGLVGFEVTVDFTNERAGVQRTFSILLPRGARQVRVPPNFLAEGARLPGTEFGAEVLAIEDSGNKTITERGFRVRRP